MRQLGVLNRANPLRIAAAWGFPTMMSSYSEIKFVIAPAETVIISQYRDVRYVYTDGRAHPPEDELWPNNWGDSTGCWNGDTLTIDTIGAKFDPVFNYLARRCPSRRTSSSACASWRPTGSKARWSSLIPKR
jgi:hypothetical protein